MCCFDVAKILSTAFETGWRLEIATLNDKTSSPVKNFEIQFGILNEKAKHLLLHLTTITAKLTADKKL